MSSFNRRQFLQSAALAAGGSMLLPADIWAKLAPGVETEAPVYVTTEERFNQPNLWVMQVNYKPIRMLRVELQDPKTGEVEPRLIWYLCYRAINRPIQHRKEDDRRAPLSEEAKAETALFIPELTLVTNDNDVQKIYIDQVIPIAQAAIEKREKHKYKNSVEIKGTVPPPTPIGSTSERWIYGVATWRGIDPAADRFTAYFSGFSNGYEVKKGPDDQEIVLRKTLVQKFLRYGDEFDPTEREFRRDGSPKWIYR